MFLTKKEIRKIVFLAIRILVGGLLLILAGYLYGKMDGNPAFLRGLGIFFCALSVPAVLLSVYADGKAEYINSGFKKVRDELRPADFLLQYKYVSEREDLAVKKPDFKVLQFVLNAHSLLGDTENAQKTVEEMLAVASKKQKAVAMLLKASMCYSLEKVDEAEKILAEVRKKKLGAVAKLGLENIEKTDRAISMGDYKTAEMQFVKMLDTKFPKPDNATKLATNFNLGLIYEKLEDKQKAIAHYKYCADFGGETALRTKAKEKLEELQNEV